jgi:hypothetical protein
LALIDSAQSGFLIERVSGEIEEDYSLRVARELGKDKARLFPLFYRTYWYIMLSSMTGIPYSPETLRAPIVGGKVDAVMRSSAPSTAMDEIRRNIRSVAVRADEKWGLNMTFHDLPPTFSLVCDKARTRGDILTAALELRESDEAQKFRSFISDMARAAVEGDLTLVHTLEAELHRLMSGTFRVGRKEALRIKGFDALAAIAPFVSISLTGVGLSSTAAEFGSRVSSWRTRRRLVLLDRVASRANNILETNKQLARMGLELTRSQQDFLIQLKGLRE